MAGRDGDSRTAIATALPGYDVQGVLGRGAMGVVLGGRHRKLDRAVAIKQLPPAVAEDEEARARFGTEARVLASLTHPHIVPVFDYVEREGLCLLVMEALPGGSVWDRFTTDGLTPATTCAVAVATCAGLQHAHDQQVLHRDIKPENLLFAGDQTLKVTDFGIAEVLGGDQTLATAEGGVVGTPAYMAPEQAEGGALGPTADVYATGTLLYELLSGRLPFEADDAVDLLNRRLAEDPRPLTDVAAHVPGPLVEVVMRALARDPGRRQASARELGGEVVAAAADAWGPDWLEHSAVNVLTPLAPIRSTAPAPTTDEAPVVAEPTVDRTRGTRVSGEATAPDADAVVRPTLATGRVRQDGTRISDLGRDDLVAVQDILTPPPVPLRGLAALAACLVALVLVALLGPGAPDRTASDVAAERVVLGGTDLAAADAASLDFAGDIGLLVDRRVARGATKAELELSVAGIPVGSTGREELKRAGQGSATTFSVGNLQHLTAGTMTGRLVL
ncbi:MAG TPA: serine/threonine-protein kinase, partial [Acidimicrobiales bacterium]|nr:serine/threonine-protein kinase [Acidimicrobiales bacterium]